jgi:hypothetical protein
MISMPILHETPCAMGSGYYALVVIDDARIRGEIRLQSLPVYAEIWTDAWIVSDSKSVIEKELVDWFHKEIEKFKIRSTA